MFIKLTLWESEELIRVNPDNIDVYHPLIMDGKVHSKVYIGTDYWIVHETPNEIDVKIKKAKKIMV